MKLVLIGIPGAGKSTQGNLLSKQLKLPYLSTGHIFREIAKEKTQMGRYVKETLNAGYLLPDEQAIEVVNTYLGRPEYKHGYILDGFPRTLQQAEKFHNSVDKVIYLEIPDKEALWRLAHRTNDDGREDNTVIAIRKRIEIFHKFTQPVIDFYEKHEKLVVIDGMQKVEDVNEEILKSLGKQLIKNQIEEWKQKNKSIIAIVGLTGSGKSEAARFFKEMEIPVIEFGKIVNDYIDHHKLDHNEEIHNKVRLELRQKHGLEAMVTLNKEKIAKALKKHMVVVIDGLYTWEEYNALRRDLPDVRLFLLALYANKELRYHRLKHREYRSEIQGEQRDLDELTYLTKGSPIAFADFLILNNSTIQELHDKLEQVYREVYFS